MEVFVRGLPLRATENEFSKFIRSSLEELDIHDWHCQKRKQKTFAFLTFLKLRDGERFLARHGQAQLVFSALSLSTDRSSLSYFGAPLLCSRSNKPPNPLALKSLEMESKARLNMKPSNPRNEPERQLKSPGGSLKVVAISCGQWGYRNSRPVFLPYCDWNLRGTIKFSTRMAIVSLETPARIDFDFSTIEELNLEGLPQAAITMTLNQAPRFLRPTLAASHMQPNWTRIPWLNDQHEMISGTCLVYRIHLESTGIDQLKKAMGRAHCILLPISQHVEVVAPTQSYKAEMTHFLQSLEAQSSTRYPASLPFTVKFQLQKLVQNAYMSPSNVCELLPEIDEILTRAGPRICASAIRRLCSQLPFRYLQTDANEADIPAVIAHLRSNEERLTGGDIYGYAAPSLQDRAFIHRIAFSPSGMQLIGPDAESHNRVLRKFRHNHDFFARVVFYDENGEPIHFSAQWSNDVLYHERFKKILNEGFSVAGRRYNFFAFSHSSLRAQSCWFMAPFVHEGSLLFDRKLIQGLGDFSEIRCPAKCAARIGQAFSETPIAISVEAGVAQVIPDIERNGRVFSDGVGTISRPLLEKLWAALPLERRGKARAFQIRYSGKWFTHCGWNSHPLASSLSSYIGLLWSCPVMFRLPQKLTLLQAPRE